MTSAVPSPLLSPEFEFRDLHDLIAEFAGYEAIGTDDVLAAVLPLMRQTAELHEQGRVAPLDGVEALRVERGRLWFENARSHTPRRMTFEISRLQGMESALDISVAADVADADAAPIGKRGERPDRPVYLPDYRSWEQAVGHHDPLTDVFCLGMIAAALAVGLDLTEEDQLERLVRARRQLTQLNPRLHPVVAKILARATELDRRRRPQTLAAVVAGLERHREAPRAVETNGAQLPRGQQILAALRGRLYDLSRRNKLIFHKPSGAELNLTEASTPVVLRPEAIRPEQLFTWTGPLPARLLGVEQEAAGAEDASEKDGPGRLALSEFIRFDEVQYATAALERIRAQARSDRAEYGVSQLRLVVAFLRWRNLRDDAETPISSPLILAPAELTKRRGVRDSYEIRLTSPTAEVNATLGRYLKLIYDIDLPREIDLETPGAIQALHEQLCDQIAAAEPGVRLDLVARPRVQEMHARNTQRRDLYQRRAHPAGSALKKHGGLRYSYQRIGFQPLGAQLYHAFVRPAAAPALTGSATAATAKVAASRARPSHMAPPPQETATRAPKAEAPAAAATSQGARGPYEWEIDLCSVTLANFNSRKMSLLRDFDALLDGALQQGDGAFGRLFADAPRPLPAPAPTPPLVETWPVVASDPTQDAAVHRARTGESYVIQGPPGTGKSQTIANLIADYLGRGKRVLFVCEKRAALDVVHHRLESLGLHRLCALVHDSQEDRRPFVKDLKALYESWIDSRPDDGVEEERQAAAAAVARGLETFADLDQDMTRTADGEAMHTLLAQAALAARDRRAGVIDPPAELLPSFADWRAGREAVKSVEAALARLGAEPVLARHPARYVAPEACADPALFDRLAGALDALGPHLERLGGAAEMIVWTEESAPPLAALFAQIDYARRLEPVAAARKLAVLQADSLLAETFRNDARWLEEARETLARAQEMTRIWREKLTPLETETALGVARRHEGKLLSFLSPVWRQIKAEVTERAGLEELKIQPRIADILADLAAEHKAAADIERGLRGLAALIGAPTGEDAIAIAAERDAGLPKEGRHAVALLKLATRAPEEAAERIMALAALGSAADDARAALADCFDGIETLPADRAFGAISALEAQRDELPAFAPALRALASAPETVRTALRRIDAPADDIEAALVEAAVGRALAVRPALREASGAALDDAAASVTAALSSFRKSNARALIDRTRRRFADAAALTTRLDLELDAEAERERRALIKARQELDREFARKTRHRSLRELLSCPAGRLIRDLKPIWLMSPLSVADVLPLDPEMFDVVIFDEASQVPVEDAAPSLFRAPQTIVVGDEKQLPPTNFFGRARSEEEDEADEDAAPTPPSIETDEDDVDDAVLDLDADSFLGQAARTLASTLLGWHYRSRSEELIAFSNAVFYGGKLVSVPSTRRAEGAEPIVAEGPADGPKGAREILARPLSFHHTPFATYDRQRNRGEAGYIAEAVRALLLAKTGKTIGVVAFSEAQQRAIEKALETLAQKDAKFRALYDAELEREQDGQFAGLFVKNLENVQGDERDVIIVSVCYAPDGQGRMRMNFGPINRAGGEKRLNVIFSRAREHVALISTIKADAVTNDYNAGALCLKTYLRYAEAASVGDVEGMRRALSTVAPHALGDRRGKAAPLAEEIAAALREREVDAVAALGESAFVCDVAVRRPGAAAHQLAVLIDGPAHYANPHLLERHVVKPAVLNAFGWTTLTVLTVDWRRSPDQVLDRIEKALARVAEGG